MNDEQLGLLMESWLKETDSPPGDVGRSTAQIESRLPQTRQHSRWWPLPSHERLPAPVAGRSPAGGSSMFSAVKFVAAAAILALFGGFLLSGILTTPQDAEILPAAVTESPSPMVTEESSSSMDAFPTGYFVSVDTGRVTLEFQGDGTGMTHSAALNSTTPSTMPFTYAVDGNVYTAVKGGSAVLRVESKKVGSATYRWDYDGERLAFELIGEDTEDRRKSLLANNTFRSIEDPQVVMVATFDLDVGDPIRAWLAFVPAAEVGPDAYTSKAEYADRVVAVPIAKGQPITPDLLEPMPVADSPEP